METECIHCEKVFDDNSELRTHVAIFHEDIWVLCAYCGGMFTSVGRLQEHNLRMHPRYANPEMRCLQCYRFFARSDDLIDHIKTEHLSELFVCKYCAEDFNSRAERDAHVVKHKKKAKVVVKIKK